LRIALVSEFFYPNLGGIQECLYFMAKEYIRMGHEPVIVTPHVFTDREPEDWWPKDLPTSAYKAMGYSLPVFINGSLGRSAVGFFLGERMRRLLTKENFDIVHLHSPLNGALPLLASHYSSVPVVGTFHTSFSQSKSFEIFHKAGQRHIDRLSYVTAVAPISLKSIQKFFDVKAEVLPNGINTDLFRPRADGPDDRFPQYVDGKLNIFFIGRPDPRNGLDTLIPAFAKVHKLEPNTRLIVAGAGKLLPRFVEMAQQLAPGAVDFLGPVHAERPQLYRTADIQVFGVERACCSLTLLEGMATGLPIITNDFIGYEYHGERDKHFIVTKIWDVDGMAKSLLELVRDPALRARFGAAARERALQFSWTPITQRFLKIYQHVLDREASA